MDLPKQITRRTIRSPMVCRICGDVARGMNFGVITCMSCKAFFRRHALQSGKIFHCHLDFDCYITKSTRGGCSGCRLKKCFALGMNPNLIRSPYKKQNKQRTIVCVSQPKPLSLLNQDRSTLTIDEWNLLSNIIHAYDEQNISIRTQACFKEQLSLPPKIRSKKSNALELIGSFYTAIQPFIERCPYFHTLPLHIRKLIIQNNFNGTGGFNTMIASLEGHVFDNEGHVSICNEIYGVEYVKESRRLLSKLEPNRTLMKVLLMILLFSSNCSIVSYDEPIDFINIPSVKSSFQFYRIQDIFITMLWKYYVYQYGFIDAVRHFTSLVKNYLDVLNRMHENLSEQHWQMVDTIVEKTTDSLESDS